MLSTSWQFAVILPALLVIILLLLWIAVHANREAHSPYKTLGDLEDAYQKGALSWEEYDRWRRRMTPQR